MNKLISTWLCLSLGLASFAQTAQLSRDAAPVTALMAPPSAPPTTEQGTNYLREPSISFGEIDHDTLPLWLSKSPLTLSEVVVSATRWRQEGRDVPYRIAGIRPKEVALLNPQTTADLLGLTGEVFIQKSQQGGGSPMMRGFATNRLLIAVDGVRMNTAIFRSGNLQNVISLDPFSIQNTEVLFGPGSVIYGSDAVGGVMNFTTLQPRLSGEAKAPITGSAVVRHSSVNDELTAHLDLNAAWEKFALTTSLTHSDFGDLRMGTNGPDEYLRPFYVSRMDNKDVVMANTDPLVQRPTGYQQINLMQKARYRPNDNWDITYGLHYSTTTDYDRYDRLLRTRQGLPRSAEWRYGPQLWAMNNLAVSHTKPTGFYDEMSLRLAHQFFEESRIDRDFNDTERRTRTEKVNAWSANLDLRKALGQRHVLFYGLEYVFDDVNSSGTDEDIEAGTSQPGPARYPQAEWSSYAAYLSWQFRASPKLTLHSGARYNGFGLDARFDTRFYPFPFTEASMNNDALTGNLGLVYRPTEAWQLRANLSSGFRSPNVDDVGKVFDSEPGAVVVPNPGLGPEYAWNAEAGIARVFGERLRLDVTAFYTLLENALVRRDFTLNGQDSILYDGEMSRVQAIQNAAEARVWGIHAGLELQLPGGWGISSRLTWQDGEEELDDGTIDPLRHAAPMFGITRLTYSARKLRMEAYLAYSSEVSNSNLAVEEQGKGYIYAVDKNGNPYSPSWATLNFKTLYQLSEQWALSGGVENITDRRYRPYSSGIVAAGRNFVLSLRAVF